MRFSDNTGTGFSRSWDGLCAALGPDQAFYAPQRARSSNKRVLKDARAGSSRCALPRYGRRTVRLPDKYRCHRPRRPSRSCKRQQRRDQRWAYSDWSTTWALVLMPNAARGVQHARGNAEGVERRGRDGPHVFCLFAPFDIGARVVLLDFVGQVIGHRRQFSWRDRRWYRP